MRCVRNARLRRVGFGEAGKLFAHDVRKSVFSSRQIQRFSV